MVVVKAEGDGEPLAPGEDPLCSSPPRKLTLFRFDLSEWQRSLICPRKAEGVRRAGNSRRKETGFIFSIACIFLRLSLLDTQFTGTWRLETLVTEFIAFRWEFIRF